MADEVLEMEFRMRDFITQNMKTIEKGLDDVGKKFDQTSEKSKKTESAMEKLGKVTQGLAGAFMALYGLKKATDFMMGFAEAADKQMMAEAMLTNALGKTSEALKRQAMELQKVTRYGDEETMAAQARVAAYVKDENMIKQLIPVIQDFASAKQIDLATAADAVSKAIVGQATMLSKYGIQVQGEAKTVERFNSVVEQLGATFKGTAETVGAAGLGPWKQFENQLGDISEDIGVLLIPSLNMAAKALGEMTTGFRVLAGLGTGDAIKDLTLVNEQVDVLSKKIEDRKSGKGFESGLSKFFGSNIAEAAEMQKELDGLLATQADLEKRAKEILNPTKTTPSAAAFVGETPEPEQTKEEKKWGNLAGIQMMSEMQQNFIEDTYKKQVDVDAKTLEELKAAYQKQDDAFMEHLETFRIGANEINAIEQLNTDMTKEQFDERLALTQQFADQSIEIFSGLNQISINMIEREREAQLKKVSTQIMSEKQRAKAIEEINKKADAERLKAAKRDKALSIIQSVINTAVAITSALATKPAPLGIAMAAMVGAAGAVQIGTIASQKLAVGGRTLGGMTLVGEQGPEMVSLPRGSQVLSAIDTRNAINQVTNNNMTQNSGGNQYTIVVQDRMTGNSLRDMLRAGELDNFLVDLKQRGRL